MVRAGLIVSLLSIGTLVGALAGAPIADALGRRWAMIVECGVFIVGVIIQLLSFSSWQQFAVGRLVSGLGVGALSAAVPMVCRYMTLTALVTYATILSIKQKQHHHRFEALSQQHINFSSLLAY